MTQSFDAAIFTDGKADIRPVRIAEMRDDEVLVRIVAAGVCHTDLVFSEGFLKAEYPIILGHEGAGIVEKVGKAVTKVVPGDPVVLTFLSCGDCINCRAGKPYACETMGAMNGSGHRPDGSDPLADEHGPVASHFFGQSSFAAYSIANQRNVVKVRADAPLELLGPLGCGVQTGAGATMNTLAAQAGESFVVFGAGSVGLSALMAAKALGCDPIVAVEPHAQRREVALELGATHVFDPTTESDLVEKIRAVTGRGFQHAVDTSGVPAVVAQALATLGVGGKIAIISTNSVEGAIPLNLMDLLGRSLTILGCTEGSADPDIFIPQLVELIMAGRFPLEKLVRYYPFAEINTAMHDTHAGVTLKPILKMA